MECELGDRTSYVRQQVSQIESRRSMNLHSSNSRSRQSMARSMSRESNQYNNRTMSRTMSRTATRSLSRSMSTGRDDITLRMLRLTDPKAQEICLEDHMLHAQEIGATPPGSVAFGLEPEAPAPSPMKNNHQTDLSDDISECNSSNYRGHRHSMAVDHDFKQVNLDDFFTKLTRSSSQINVNNQLNNHHQALSSSSSPVNPSSSNPKTYNKASTPVLPSNLSHYRTSTTFVPSSSTPVCRIESKKLERNESRSRNSILKPKELAFDNKKLSENTVSDTEASEMSVSTISSLGEEGPEEESSDKKLVEKKKSIRWSSMVEVCEEIGPNQFRRHYSLEKKGNEESVIKDGFKRKNSFWSFLFLCRSTSAVASSSVKR
jgi:hypothetical protein